MTVPAGAFSPTFNFQHPPCPHEQTVEAGPAPRLSPVPATQPLTAPNLLWDDSSPQEVSGLKADQHALFPRTPQHISPPTGQKIKVVSKCCLVVFAAPGSGRYSGELRVGPEGAPLHLAKIWPGADTPHELFPLRVPKVPTVMGTLLHTQPLLKSVPPATPGPVTPQKKAGVSPFALRGSRLLRLDLSPLTAHPLFS